MIYIGIDNGLSGGLVALSDHPGPPVSMIRTPVQTVRGKNEINILAIKDWLQQFDHQQISAFIEVPTNARNATVGGSMWGSFQAIRCMLDLRQIRYQRVTPQAWQKKMIPGADKGETKAEAMVAARQLWPSEKFIPDGCKKPQDGLIDAALIAEYGRRANL